jgi:hypothetical protein
LFRLTARLPHIGKAKSTRRKGGRVRGKTSQKRSKAR